MTAARAGAPALQLVTDRRAVASLTLAGLVEAALAGGVTRVQVRERDLEGGPLLRLVEEILAVAARLGRGKASIVVNDRLDVALAAGAAGVHLPAAGLPLRPTRARAGPRFRIGRSVHSLAEAKAAEKEGASEILFGPIFATPSKASFGPPQGVEALRKVAEAVRIPVWAIGGITPETAVALHGLPIAGIAAIGAFASAADPAQAARDLRAALDA